MSKKDQKIMEAIDILIEGRIKKLKFNYYIEARILTNNANDTCDVDYQNNTFQNVKKRSGLTVAVGDIVLICVVNSNFSNKFIDLVRP